MRFAGKCTGNVISRFSTFRLFNLSTCVAVAALFAATANAAANFPVGTHLIKGTLKDWQNKVLNSSAAVTIQAVATNGAVIAATKVRNSTSDGYNFLLQIPLSQQPTDLTSAVSNKLNLVLLQESGLSIAVDPITVGDADTVSTLTLAYVNMKSYTNGTEIVSVPAEYVDTIAIWMDAYGKEGEYDPFADYDEDGSSNYEEYMNGTNPFDATDKLRITSYSAPQNALHALSFEYVGGHIYGVATTLSLTNPKWATQPVKETEAGVEQNQVMPSAADEDVGEATIYVVPAEGATSQFFRLESK